VPRFCVDGFPVCSASTTVSAAPYQTIQWPVIPTFRVDLELYEPQICGFSSGSTTRRGPSADRERMDCDRERGCPCHTRARGRGAGGTVIVKGILDFYCGFVVSQV